MKHVPRQQDTKEFREQAVPLVLEQPVPIEWPARRLSVAGNTLKNWVGRARRKISEYIETFYNQQRRHSRLGNCSPTAFALEWARHQPGT